MCGFITNPPLLPRIKVENISRSASFPIPDKEANLPSPPPLLYSTKMEKNIPPPDT